MLKAIYNKVRQYIGLVDDVFIDTLTDLKSMRYQLIIWAFILNFVTLYLVYLGKADYKLAAVSMGLLTAVYAFFFHSKAKQAEIENAGPKVADEDPSTGGKDPDDI